MLKEIMSKWPSFLLAGLCYFILWEWLVLLQKLDTIRNLTVFLLYIVCTFVLNILPLRFKWKIAIQFSLICLILAYMYDPLEFLLKAGGLSLFMEDFMRGGEAIWNQQWEEVPNHFATLLFLFLLWTISYLIHYWIMQKKSIFLFFLLSIIFIAVVDTFTPIDGDEAIVRMMVVGLFLMGCLRFYRLRGDEKSSLRCNVLFKWVLPIVGMLALGVTLGYLMPKLPAQWRDPVPYIISYSNKFQEGNQTVKTVGYGEDDSQLGGDFLPDNTVVFTATTKRQHYWLVETKGYYTGKGWEFAEEEIRRDPLNQGEKIPYSIVDTNKTIQYTDRIEVETAYSHVLLPTPMVDGSIHTAETDSFLYNPNARKVTSIDDDGKDLNVKDYEVTYSMPVYDLTRLRTITEDEMVIPDRSSLQLPPAFPERIKTLAEEITKDADNLYDKVKAVEDYFNRSEFVYDHEDIPYPEEDEDFVDHFLFETLRGYCDHFSTSMVVMLRSIGIPAKWAKGYTNGDFVKYVDGYTEYQVTNNNAHSWVEVYFPDIGWVPFEPTKGYSNNVQFQESSNTTVNGESPSEPTREEPDVEESKNVESQEENNKGTSFSVSLTNVIQKVKENSLQIVVLILSVVGVVVSVYITRVKWLPYMWFIYFRFFPSEQTFEKAYMVLLKQLERKGLKREESQTLREYAQYVDEYFSIQDMSKLTLYYEETLYRKDKKKVEWASVKLLWKNVMKITIT